MKSLIEKMVGFEVSTYEVESGKLYAYFDKKFGVGFTIIVIDDNKIAVMPICDMPNSPNRVALSVDELPIAISEIKEKIKSRFKVSKEKAMELFLKHKGHLEVTEKCKDSLDFVMRLISHSERAKEVFADGIKTSQKTIILREDGATMLWFMFGSEKRVFKICAYVLGDEVTFLTQLDDFSVVKRTMKKEDYMGKFCTLGSFAAPHFEGIDNFEFQLEHVLQFVEDFKKDKNVLHANI